MSQDPGVGSAVLERYLDSVKPFEELRSLNNSEYPHLIGKRRGDYREIIMIENQGNLEIHPTNISRFEYMKRKLGSKEFEL